MSLEQQHHKTRFHLSEENTFSIIFYFSLGDCISLQRTAPWTVIRKECETGASCQWEVSACISDERCYPAWEHRMLMKPGIVFLPWFPGLFPHKSWHTVNLLFSFWFCVHVFGIWANPVLKSWGNSLSVGGFLFWEQMEQNEWYSSWRLLSSSCVCYFRNLSYWPDSTCWMMSGSYRSLSQAFCLSPGFNTVFPIIHKF